MNKFSIKTLGCKLNQYESAMMGQQFLQAGWTQVAFGKEADIVLINTCTVTDRSDKKCRNYIRQGAKSAKDRKVFVSGCLVERAGDDISAMPEVRKVFGNKIKDSIVPEILSEFSTGDTASLNSRYLISPLDRSRAFLKIQDGCDGECSYCVIPSVRGVPFSRDFEEILDNIKILAGNGINEVVLTGITIGKYSHNGRDLADLVGAMLEITEKMRFRITSIEPVHISEKLISLFSNERICGHIHLPLQSGSDRVLAEMNRPYSTADYLQMTEALRKVRPDIAIGTDVIVGFPGETDADFSETMTTLAKGGVSYIHQFTFSPRSGTPASLRNDFCNDTVVFRRSEELRKFSAQQRKKYHDKFTGEVLEGIVEIDSSGCWATTGNYIRVRLKNGSEMSPSSGSLVKVRIDKIGEFPEGVIVPG